MAAITQETGLNININTLEMMAEKVENSTNQLSVFTDRLIGQCNEAKSENIEVDRPEPQGQLNIQSDAIVRLDNKINRLQDGLTRLVNSGAL